jgi:vacuolar-type H+-ATPase subunit H
MSDIEGPEILEIPEGALGLEGVLDALDRVIDAARAMPLSSSVMVNRGEVTGLLRELRDGLPEEVAQARWVVRERDGILEHARNDAEQILADARAERDAMLDEDYLVRAAKDEAGRVIDAAHETARQLRLEAEDYVDAKLANFEVVLHKTLTAVERGRERLRGRLDVDALGEPLDDHTSDDLAPGER